MESLDDWELKALWYLHKEWLDEESAMIYGISEDELEKLKSLGLAQKKGGRWGPTAKGSTFVELNGSKIEKLVRAMD